MKRPIIALTHTKWHQPWWMSRQQLMSRLAQRGWPVVYSNGPLSIWDRGTTRWSKARFFGSTEVVSFDGQEHVLLDHSPRILTTWKRVPLVSATVTRAYARRLRRLVRRRSSAPPIIFLTDPKMLDLAEMINRDDIVLYVNDQWRRLDGWTQASDNLLARSVNRAKLIISVADTMANDLPGDGPQRSRILPHGVDVRVFQACADEPCPEDLARIPRPRLGYVGRVSKKVDLELVRSIATERPEWHWVFIGAVGIGFGGDEDAYKTLEELRLRPNVHFLGVRDRKEVPTYLAHMDVNTICFRTTSDGFWGGTSPTKLWEYFASGRPIVSTPLDTVMAWSGLVRISASCEGWINEIDCLLTQPDIALSGNLRDAAADNSWDHRTTQLESWFMQM